MSIRNHLGLAFISLTLIYAVGIAVKIMQNSKTEISMQSSFENEDAIPEISMLKKDPDNTPALMTLKYTVPSSPVIVLYGPYIYGPNETTVWDSLPPKRAEPPIDNENNSPEFLLEWANHR